MSPRRSEQTKALWLFRGCLILGILVIPSILPVTWMNAALSDKRLAQSDRIQELEHRVLRLERQVATQPLRVPPKAEQAVKKRIEKAAAPKAGKGEKTARDLPAARPPRDPLVTRIQRRLALVETVIRWRRKSGAGEDLAHHAAGMGVVHGPSGDLLVTRALADPWADRSLQSQRETVQRQGGTAQVLYRVWGSGLRVLGKGGKVNAQNAMVFDQPLRLRDFGQGLVRLENVGFPGEDEVTAVAPAAQQTVLAFRWPTAVRAGLPDETRPLQSDLAFGVLSPACAGCVLFDEQGQLVGRVDGIGQHQSLPNLTAR